MMETYRLEIGDCVRELPLCEVAPGLKIAVLNSLGDKELLESCVDELCGILWNDELEFDFLVTPEAKSIPLAHDLAWATEKDYVVLRKSYKRYMGIAPEVVTNSITTGRPQSLFLDERDHDRIKGKRVVLVDDVISTGSTLEAMRELMRKAKAEVVAVAAIATEGDERADVISLAHLPLFRGGE